MILENQSSTPLRWDERARSLRLAPGEKLWLQRGEQIVVEPWSRGRDVGLVWRQNDAAGAVAAVAEFAEFAVSA